MQPNEKPSAGPEQQAASLPAMSPEEYFGMSTINEKEALRDHSADTPEGLSRALNEQMGGTDSTVRPRPNEL